MQRVTYSGTNLDFNSLHQQFDLALTKVRNELTKTIQESSSQRLIDRNPSRTPEILASFEITPRSKISDIMENAHLAQKDFARRPWQFRSEVLMKAADKIREWRFEIAATMSLEAGKNRLESLGDVDESADLMTYYAHQLIENDGFQKKLKPHSPQEEAWSFLKPYGVFVVISPFNFPLALATGMAAGALLAGNSVVLKPSSETPWVITYLQKALQEAGLPENIFQVVWGAGSELGNALINHPRTAGVAFTGSSPVGMDILHKLSAKFPKPCLLEMGGKNAAIITRSADLEAAAEGCARSAFGLGGQKCSALSRLFIHEDVFNDFMDKCVKVSRSFTVGDPTRKEVFLGPLINEKAVNRHLLAIADARRDGLIYFGGEDYRSISELSLGHFAQPTIVTIPRQHRLFREELFSPFLIVEKFKNFDEALMLANDSEYGLTAGIFSNEEKEIQLFLETIEAGVTYVNRRTGATTGAWPGVNSFCGWKASGSTGKGGCGPYYVSQFMREQSQLRVRTLS